ncbi:MAG: dihydrofolate reductase [Mycoplasmatales bacterium]
MISMILAMDKQKLIGNTKSSNGLPWHYQEDLEFYKQKTVYKKNIMGRKTYEQIGRALPNRETYVLTKNTTLTYSDATMINDIHDILKINQQNPQEEIMIIGGVEIFELFKPYVDIIYLTLVDKAYTGDVYYSNFTTDNFTLKEEIPGQNKELLFQRWEKDAT